MDPCNYRSVAPLPSAPSKPENRKDREEDGDVNVSVEEPLGIGNLTQAKSGVVDEKRQAGESCTQVDGE